METGSNAHFDITTLLKQEALGMRSFATANPSFSIDEYCGILSEFTNLAPDIQKDLTKFSARDGDKDDC